MLFVSVDLVALVDIVSSADVLCQLVKIRNQNVVIVLGECWNALAVVWSCVCAPGCDRAWEGLWRALGAVSCSELSWAARVTEPCSGCKAVSEKSKPETTFGS